MKSKWVWALFAMVLGAGIWGGTLMATQPSGTGDHDTREVQVR